MFQKEDAAARIHNWVLGHFPLASESGVGQDDSLLESGIVDSLGTLDIVMFLEDEFGLVVDDEDMVADHFESVKSICDFVGQKVQA